MGSSKSARRFAVVLAASGLVACGGHEQAQIASTCPVDVANAGEGPLADLGWMAGTWVATSPAGSRTEESWTVPHGSVMPGATYTESSDGRTENWEARRIERRGSLVFLVALPRGDRFETPYRAVEIDEGHAVFENARAEFPQRIEYTLESPCTLRAAESDLRGSSGKTWMFTRRVD